MWRVHPTLYTLQLHDIHVFWKYVNIRHSNIKWKYRWNGRWKICQVWKLGGPWPTWPTLVCQPCKKSPDIGKKIEKLVESCSVGVDAWRHTGVLTFDGNEKGEKKCTYRRIQEHLEQVYKRHFSYGTVIQLCIARNRRRKSARRYYGVAQVTSRRAQKGFEIRLNPNRHWSAALYCNLNIL